MFCSLNRDRRQQCGQEVGKKESQPGLNCQLSVIHCVAPGKWPKHPSPQFLIHKMGILIRPTFWDS